MQPRYNLCSTLYSCVKCSPNVHNYTNTIKNLLPVCKRTKCQGLRPPHFGKTSKTCNHLLLLHTHVCHSAHEILNKLHLEQSFAVYRNVCCGWNLSLGRKIIFFPSLKIHLCLQKCIQASFCSPAGYMLYLHALAFNLNTTKEMMQRNSGSLH